MVVVYYRPGCSSSARALEWLKEHGVPYKKYRIEQISKEQLLIILTLTENGLTDLFKGKGNLSTRTKITDIQEIKFNEAIDYVSQHPELIRTPILHSRNKLLIGYHETDIRQFIPHNYRLIRW